MIQHLGSPKPLFVLLVIAFMNFVSPAEAHRINLFVVWDGAGLTGSMYYSGGGKAKNAEIEVYAPEGGTLATTRTNADGQFHIPAEVFSAYRDKTVKVWGDTGDGHAANMAVLIGEPKVARSALDAEPEMATWRKYVGAIGLIFGLFGMMYWLKARKGDGAP